LPRAIKKKKRKKT